MHGPLSEGPSFFITQLADVNDHLFMRKMLADVDRDMSYQSHRGVNFVASHYYAQVFIILLSWFK